MQIRPLPLFLAFSAAAFAAACNDSDDSPGAVVTAPTNLVYANPALTFGTCENASEIPTLTGGPATFAVVPALPQGLMLDVDDGAISGIAEAITASASYVITASNSLGMTDATITIEIVDAVDPGNLVYSDPNPTYLASMPITANQPTFDGNLNSFTVSPALPPGLNLSALTGVITGTPTAPSNATVYTIEGTNCESQSTQATVTITVTGADPLFANQWHHDNTGQMGGTPGEDARTADAWELGFDGTGSRIAIVDNGLQIGHPDLSGNIVPGGSKSYTGGGTDPGLGDHGTSCGGVAAAVAFNNLGGRGAAFSADLIGLNLLQNNTAANQIDAMTFDNQAVGVSSNSWGPADTLGVLEDSPSTWRGAIEDGLSLGRGGLGTIYTWACGNGAFASGVGLVDDSNYDGYANFYGVIAVAAVGDDGEQAFYSESGANVWIAAPSQGNSGQAITTTDLTGGGGFNNGSTPGDYPDPNYTNTFNGTSSATPLVSGVIGLMLDANPNLTWSDVRVILAQTARLNDPSDPDWTTNGAGYDINHAYGFGTIDAEAAVTAASTWVSLGPLVSEDTGNLTVTGGEITDNDPTPVTITVPVSGSALTELEFVHVYVNIPDHNYWPDLEIEVTSPAGTTSRLASVHAAVESSSGSGIVLPVLNNWRFGVARCLGEGVNGTWTVTVRDLVAGLTGTVTSLRFEFYGR